MITIINDFIALFGLNYTPTTVPELLTWMILVLAAISLVCCVIRVMFYLCELSIRGGNKKW